MNPDLLRLNQKAMWLIRDFFAQHKPDAAICHGPWTLIDAGVLAGRRVTSYPSLKRDLENAGATWENQSVVCDRGLVTSRTPEDLDDFCASIINEIAKAGGRSSGGWANSLRDIYIKGLRQIYDAEVQLQTADADMLRNASNQELQSAFEQQYGDTQRHQASVEQIVEGLNTSPDGERNEGVAGLIRGSQALLQAEADPNAKDAALITISQQSRHFAAASYGALCTYAETMERMEDLRLLREMLSHEKSADDKLNTIAKNVVLPKLTA